MVFLVGQKGRINAPRGSMGDFRKQGCPPKRIKTDKFSPKSVAS